jgi:RNA-binding protein
MTELTLSGEERLRLKSSSHHLEPVVLLGANGLTEAVLREIDRALSAHQLVKVRTPASQRQERERLFAEVAERLGAARIQLIGRLMVLFRPAPQAPAPRASRAPSPARGRGSDTPPRPRAATPSAPSHRRRKQEVATRAPSSPSSRPARPKVAKGPRRVVRKRPQT